MSWLDALASALGDAPSNAQPRLYLGERLALADPWFLLVVPVGIAALLVARRRGAALGASGAPAAELPRSWRQRLAPLAPALFVLAVAGVGAALARPVLADPVVSDDSEGVDILLLLDRSTSMRRDDLAEGRTRLDVAKEVVRDFAVRRMTDTEGASDNVGLMVFAGFPQLVCPFTLDADALTGFLEPVTFQEGGTAIGDSLAKAVDVLSHSEARSRVVVLLTDGVDEGSTIPPLSAADLAETEGVRVYTVFVERYQYRRTSFFGGLEAVESTREPVELQAIAEGTGGEFFTARDPEGLEAAYAAIEELERTPRRVERTVVARDLYPALLALALGCYLGSWLCASTFARRALG